MAARIPGNAGRCASLDMRLYGWALQRRKAALISPVLAVTRAGSSAVVCLAGPMIPAAITLSRTHSPRKALASGTSTLRILVAGLAMRRVLMECVRRERPQRDQWAYDATGYAFPSGHSTNAAMAAGLVIAAASASRRCDMVAAAASGYAAAVGASRVYLGVHWPSDVLAGWLLGASWSILGRYLDCTLRRRGTREIVGGRFMNAASAGRLVLPRPRPDEDRQRWGCRPYRGRSC
jgi:membrane-associated phospholipid phosphatase